VRPGGYIPCTSAVRGNCFICCFSTKIQPRHGAAFLSRSRHPTAPNTSFRWHEVGGRVNGDGQQRDARAALVYRSRPLLLLISSQCRATGRVRDTERAQEPCLARQDDSARRTYARTRVQTKQGPPCFLLRRASTQRSERTRELPHATVVKTTRNLM
jgi:hypothetical protein